MSQYNNNGTGKPRSPTTSPLLAPSSAPMVVPPPSYSPALVPPSSSSSPPPTGQMSSAPYAPMPPMTPLPSNAIPGGPGVQGMAASMAASAPLLAAAAIAGSSSFTSRLSGLLPQRWSVSGLREYRDSKFQHLRPVSDFMDVRRVRSPGTWAVASERASANWTYYQTNYLLVFWLICCYALLSSPLLLFALLFLAVGYHVVNSAGSPTITILGSTLSTAQANTYLALLSLPLLWLGSAGSTVFWIVGVSVVLIGGHAAALEPPVERAFEQSV
ncbi:PRA1 family protein-domain-containing protein [Blastocladiella britannica]|nr:PRA1 family protein-domain-containing protein [Blastocladiella britannica]